LPVKGIFNEKPLEPLNPRTQLNVCRRKRKNDETPRKGLEIWVRY
jgi:hypothetical protein